MDWGDGDIPALSAVNVRADGLDLSRTSHFGSERLYARWMTQGDVERGDVLITTEAPMGNIVQVPDDRKYILSQRVILLKPKRGMVDPRFLAHQLRGPAFQTLLNGDKSGTTVAGIRQSRLMDLEVRVPALDVQRRIVAKVDELLAQSHAAREQLEAVPALVEQYRQSVLAAAFRGDLTKEWRAKNPDAEPASKLLERIRSERRRQWEAAELAKMKAKGKAPKDDEWKAKYEEPEPVDASELPELPSTWCWASFDELVQNSLYGPRFGESDYVPNGVPTVRTTDMTRSGAVSPSNPPCVRVTDEQLAQLGLVHHDLLVTRTGSIGRVALYEASLGPALPSAYLIRFRLVLPLVSARYVLGFMLSPRAQIAMGAGATAVTQPNINARTLGRIPVPLPPTGEQAAVDAVLDARMLQVEPLTATAHRDVDSLERSLLAKAFRGELDLDGTDAEVVRLQEAAADACAKGQGGRKTA